MTSKHGHKTVSCMEPLELKATVEELKNTVPKGSLVIGRDEKGEQVLVANTSQAADVISSILQERNDEFTAFMTTPPITAG